jgi:hypothetical protein
MITTRDIILKHALTAADKAADEAYEAAYVTYREDDRTRAAAYEAADDAHEAAVQAAYDSYNAWSANAARQRMKVRYGA